MERVHHAGQAGQLTPANERAIDFLRTEAPLDQQTPRNFASNGAERKAVATLTAQFAMRGYELRLLGDGSLLVARWNLVRPLANLKAAEAFLRQIGGGHG